MYVEDEQEKMENVSGAEVFETVILAPSTNFKNPQPFISWIYPIPAILELDEASGSVYNQNVKDAGWRTSDECGSREIVHCTGSDW